MSTKRPTTTKMLIVQYIEYNNIQGLGKDYDKLRANSPRADQHAQRGAYPRGRRQHGQGAGDDADEDCEGEALQLSDDED